MKLAHYSDIHITHFPLSEGFRLKRLAAVVSYASGRGKHFEGSNERIARLLEDVDAQQVDHALCTGDLTGVSTSKEYAEVAGLFGARLQQPEKLTVIPGNHDRYVTGAEGLFDQHFAKVSEGAKFPFVKHLPSGVTIVAIDVARPTSIVDSSGLCGETQRKALEGILTDTSLKDRFVVMAQHYGLLRAEGQRDTRSHGLRDDLEVIALVERKDTFVDLVVHGHMHRPYIVKTGQRTAICAGSATDLHRKCGYHVYEIDPAAHRVKVQRREWNRDSRRYEAAASSLLNVELTTR